MQGFTGAFPAVTARRGITDCAMWNVSFLRPPPSDARAGQDHFQAILALEAETFLGRDDFRLNLQCLAGAARACNVIGQPALFNGWLPKK
ncbi:MAG: hypothetical protein BCS36_05635 [Desulfovibrio sp. MES5]|nr:MAG: hypothetical protein BCS36_05635 [Desulfovibrio sp. MES5]